MIVTVVQIWVKPANVAEFICATEANHRASRGEEGNLRFDFLQSRSDPARFVLYEAFASEEAAAAHKQTSHYQHWREVVEPWMAKPREGLPCAVIAPKDGGQW